MAQAIPVYYGDNDTVATVAHNLKNMGLKLSSRWNGRVEAVPLQDSKEVVLTESEARTDALKQRIEAVKKSYGDKLICHPNYKTNPRHSHNPDVYVPARAAFLAGIAAAAAADRERNPAFRRAMKISNAVGEMQ